MRKNLFWLSDEQWDSLICRRMCEVSSELTIAALSVASCIS
jgi:hypothetical protein